MSDRSDDFDRADSASLGNPSDGGSAWETLTGAFDIETNEVIAGGKAVLESSSVSGDVSVEITGGVPSAYGGPVARATDANNLLYASVQVSNGYWQLVRRQSGSPAQLAYGTDGTDGLGTWTISFTGTTVRLLRDAVQLASVTSTFNQSATKHGIYGTGGRLDNFEFVDSSVSGGNGAAFYHHLRNLGVRG